MNHSSEAKVGFFLLTEHNSSRICALHQLAIQLFNFLSIINSSRGNAARTIAQALATLALVVLALATFCFPLVVLIVANLGSPKVGVVFPCPLCSPFGMVRSTDSHGRWASRLCELQHLITTWKRFFHLVDKALSLVFPDLACLAFHRTLADELSSHHRLDRRVERAGAPGLSV